MSLLAINHIPANGRWSKKGKEKTIWFLLQLPLLEFSDNLYLKISYCMRNVNEMVKREGDVVQFNIKKH